MNSNAPKRPGEYVQKATEQTREYMARILEENERLRLEIVRKNDEITSGAANGEHIRIVERENRYLKEMVSWLEERIRTLENQNFESQVEMTKLQNRLASVDGQLQQVTKDNQDFAAQFASIERISFNLMNLYVTSHRLHASLDREEVLCAIKETIINLVGSEDFGVYELDESQRLLRLVAFFAELPECCRTVRVDDPPIGTLALTGETHFAEPGTGPSVPSSDKRVQVIVPLRLGSRVSGAIVIFGLLPQKNGALEDVDLELFDLLASHAAVALHSSAAHAPTP